MTDPNSPSHEADDSSGESALGGDVVLRGKRILVGVTGGIACYKVCELVSRLVQAGGEVTVLMTDGAREFVTPMSFEALSGRPVYTSIFQNIESHDPQHISLARSADLMVIAPCTMDALGRLAVGRADDIVTLTAAAVDLNERDILLAPSMNAVMWGQASTQRNVRQLVEDGFVMIGPSEGWQACRTSGVGRMSEAGDIFGEVLRLVGVG